MACDIKKLNEAQRAEIMVNIYEDLPISLLDKEKEQLEVGTVQEDEKQKWFVIKEQISDFPLYVRVYVQEDFDGRVDTGAVELDAVINSAIMDARYILREQ